MPSPARGLTQPQRVETSNRRLVEAAVELIAEKGWEATTAAEIGRRAGYSRAMVHARYGSKDAILEAFFTHEYVLRLSPAPEPDAPGLDEALAHFVVGLEVALDHREPVVDRGPLWPAFAFARHARGTRWSWRARWAWHTWTLTSRAAIRALVVRIAEAVRRVSGAIVLEQVAFETLERHGPEIACRHDPIGVDVVAAKRNAAAGDDVDR